MTLIELESGDYINSNKIECIERESMKVCLSDCEFDITSKDLETIKKVMK